MKSAIHVNRDDTHGLHRLVDGLFAQLQESMTKRACSSAAFKVLLTELAVYLDRAPHKAALDTLQKFGVHTGTPFPLTFMRLGLSSQPR